MASVKLSVIIHAFLMLLVVACHEASHEPETYWHSMLPKTPMPNALQYLLTTGVKNPFSVSKRAKNPMGPIFLNYASGAALKPKADINAADFVFEQDLDVGTEKDLHFYRTATSTGGFLPRAVVKSIPFSSEKLPEILHRFSVRPNSLAELLVKETLQNCESRALVTVNKYCATSLESMIDFATSNLQTKDVHATSTMIMQSKNGNLKQRYTIKSPGAKMIGSKSVICHPLLYPHAVFYCHMTHDVKIYAVPLAGADGTKVKATVICHTNTGSWNPKHIAFMALNIKPGSVPVCHFLPDDVAVWTPAK